jgi:hypothetical protein
MSETYLIILAAVILCAVLLRLLALQRPTGKAVAPSYPSDAEGVPTARHYLFFPQIRQALSATDADYLRKNASANVARKALRERRAIARCFLRGLHEDFSALARLGRTIAALSPEVSRKQETERFLLSLRFKVVYALVWLRLSGGALPVHQLEVLAGLVGRLAVRVDEAMTEISALSSRQLTDKLSV